LIYFIFLGIAGGYSRPQGVFDLFVSVHGKNIFVIASEAKQSKTVRFLRLLRPKGLAMTQKRIMLCSA